MFNMEMAAMAVLSGALAHTVRGDDGILDWASVEAAIRPRVHYFAQTGLLALENTLNLAGGTVVPLDRMEEICEKAHERGLRVHLDGARIFNAALSLGHDVRALARPFDSVMFCLSKGLGAPVGSMIVGSREFIDRALKIRVMLGGAMRQAGVLAAAGIVALTKMTARLAEDHENARSLALGLSEIDGIAIDLKRVQSNILVFDISGTGLTTPEFTARLKHRRVLANGIGPRVMRMVTHKDVSRSDCGLALQAIREGLSEG
jgi:threonine aldolase